MKEKYINRNIVLLIISLIVLLLLFFSINREEIISTVILIAILLLNIIYFINNIKIIKSYQQLEKFNYDYESGRFAETKPLFYFSKEKVKHSVLMIHGFTASTYEFIDLSKRFEKEGITFYAPMLSGFGIDDYHLLRSIKPKDWIRDCLNAYDLLAKTSDEISVIGHSMGGVLAAYLSQRKKVKHLILSAPYFYVKEEHKLLKILMMNPLTAVIICWLYPIVSKSNETINERTTLEKKINKRRFVYDVVPVEAVKSLWELQEFVDLSKIQFQTLSLLYGKNDNSVNIKRIKDSFTNLNFIYDDYVFPESGHNILEDIEKDEVIEKIVKIINSE